MKLGQKVELQITDQERQVLIKELRAKVLEHLRAIVLNQVIEKQRDRVNYWAGLLEEELMQDIINQFPMEGEETK